MKIGFIGGWGHHYLRGLLANDQTAAYSGSTLFEAAVCGDGHDAEAAMRFAKGVQVSNWFDDPIQMLDVFKPDLLSVGSVYAFNGELAALGLARDISTVSDKPIAATWKQLDHLRDLLRIKGRILLTEFDFRSRADFRAAQNAVAQGHIGEPILVTAQKSYRFGVRPAWYGDRAQYGGTLLWIASHGVDAVQWISGRKISRVIGRQNNLSRPGHGTMEDHLALLLELDNGGTGVVHADFLRPAAAATHGDDRIRIAGSKGVVEVRDGCCKLITSDNGETDITAGSNSGIGGKEGMAAVRPIHLELLAALTGENSPWFSTESSLATAELLLHARDAADSQGWVDFARQTDETTGG